MSSKRRYPKVAKGGRPKKAARWGEPAEAELQALSQIAPPPTATEDAVMEVAATVEDDPGTLQADEPKEPDTSPVVAPMSPTLPPPAPKEPEWSSLKPAGHMQKPPELAHLSDAQWESLGAVAQAFSLKQIQQGKAYRRLPPNPIRHRAVMRLLQARMTAGRNVQKMEDLMRRTGYNVYPMRLYPAVPKKSITGQQAAHYNRMAKDVLAVRYI